MANGRQMSDVEHSRSLFGSNRVSYDCPHCNERLRSPLSDAGSTDYCPGCRCGFVVPGSAKRERVLRENKQRETARTAENLAKQRLREDRKKEKQIQREAAVEAARLERQQAATKAQQQREEQSQQRQSESESEPAPSNATPRKRRNRSLQIVVGAAALTCVVFWLTCGIFVIQPIGAIPDGVTIVYWRIGTKMPFVSSADGLLEESGSGVSLLGRGAVLAGVAEPITERELFRFGYSRTLYLWSTGGKEYSK